MKKFHILRTPHIAGYEILSAYIVSGA
jgi:hypothetical protein